MNLSRSRATSREIISDKEMELIVNAPTKQWNLMQDETTSGPWDFGLDEDGRFTKVDGSGQDDFDLPDSPWTIEAIDGEADASDDTKVRTHTLQRDSTNSFLSNPNHR
jgi:hypothetical protein